MGFRVWGYSFGVWGFWGLGADLDPKKPTFLAFLHMIYGLGSGFFWRVSGLGLRVWVAFGGYGLGFGAFGGFRFIV